MNARRQTSKDLKNYYVVDDKWKSMINIFQFSFFVLITGLMYMIVKCFSTGHSSYSILTLPLIVVAFLLERQLCIAKKTKDLKRINKLLRGGMRVLGLLY